MTLFTRIEDHHKSPIYESTGLLILKLNTYTFFFNLFSTAAGVCNYSKAKARGLNGLGSAEKKVLYIFVN